jgi:hypothetical protein
VQPVQRCRISLEAQAQSAGFFQRQASHERGDDESARSAEHRVGSIRAPDASPNLAVSGLDDDRLASDVQLDSGRRMLGFSVAQTEFDRPREPVAATRSRISR